MFDINHPKGFVSPETDDPSIFIRRFGANFSVPTIFKKPVMEAAPMERNELGADEGVVAMFLALFLGEDDEWGMEVD